MAPSPYAAWADWIGAIAFDDFVARLSEDVSTRRDVVHPTALFNIYRNFQHRH